MSGHDLFGRAIGALQAGEACGLITQCSVEGSAPRGAGTQMLVLPQSEIGSIGGGNLEFRAIEQAQRLIAQHELSFLVQDYPLGPLLAQCCGGHVRLLIERLGQPDLEWLHALQASGPRTEYILTQLQHDRGPRKQLVASADHRIRGVEGLGTGFLDINHTPLTGPRPAISECAAFIEPAPRRPPHVRVYGAGHVGRALMHVLEVSELSATCFDPREDYLRCGDAWRVERLNDVSREIADAPAGAFHLVMTHSHDLDYEICRAVLSRPDVAFCGLIGSATKRTRFRKRLRTDGLSDAAIDRLTCPIGLPEIRGKHPAAIAMSAAAQLMELAGLND